MDFTVDRTPTCFYPIFISTRKRSVNAATLIQQLIRVWDLYHARLCKHVYNYQQQACFWNKYITAICYTREKFSWIWWKYYVIKNVKAKSYNSKRIRAGALTDPASAFLVLILSQELLLWFKRKSSPNSTCCPINIYSSPQGCKNKVCGGDRWELS